MTTIILHGYLHDLHPEKIAVEANSAAEAVSFLNLLPALKATGTRHHVRVEGFDSADALYDRRAIDVLHIHPVMSGSGRGGGQIVIGIIMIAAAFMSGGSSLAGNFAFGVSNASLAMAGAMMVLGGVLQALAPQPNLTADEKSRYLGNGKNTTAIGTHIPMIYGRHKAYGQFISFDIDAGVFDSAPASWYSSPFTDYGLLTHSTVDAQVEITEPSVRDHQPTSTFTGLTYPTSLVEEFQIFINFSPAVVLLAGEYDIEFQTGQTLHVTNNTAGTSSRVTLLGGEVKDLPPAGTPIAFTRNYG